MKLEKFTAFAVALVMALSMMPVFESVFSSVDYSCNYRQGVSETLCSKTIY